MRADEQITPRVIFVGDSGVGKTSIIQRFQSDAFDTQITPTIGAGASLIDYKLENETITLQIWDTAGQELYRNIVPIYFKNAACVVIVFSVEDKTSFEDLDEWFEQLTSYADPAIHKVIVCNKMDSDRHCVTEEEAQGYAEEHDSKLFFASALSGMNIPQLLEFIAYECNATKRPPFMHGLNIAPPIDQTPKKEGGCC